MPAIREIEGTEPVAVFGWDTLWGADVIDPRLLGVGDWAVADPATERQSNIGGLRSLDPFVTAIMLCLFTDRRKPDELPIPDTDPDDPSRYGWHGDTFDLRRNDGERPMGSLLYTLRRAAITRVTGLLAEYYAEDALQTLMDQGVAKSIETWHDLDSLRGKLVLHVRVTSVAGRVFEISETAAAR